jgi:hypothetical protein
MLGHGFPLGGPDFCVGLGVVGVVGADGVVGVDGVLDCVLVVLVGVVAGVVVAAPALVMPAAAPPVASAPATMVAPSSLEMVIGSNLLGSIGGVCRPSCATSLSVGAGGCRACVRGR